MVDYIKNKDVKRMFPYKFFDEFYDVLKDYTPENAVFLLRGTPHEAKLDKDLEKQFNTIRNTMIDHKQLEENNIYTLDQGSFLIIDTFIERKDVQKSIDNKPIARYLLLGQLFGPEHRPLFSKQTSDQTISKIPEVLWDDPNLALVLMQFNPSGDSENIEETSNLGIVKGPDHFINKMLAPSSKTLPEHIPARNGVSTDKEDTPHDERK